MSKTIDTEIELLKQGHTIMQRDIRELKTGQKEGFEKMEMRFSNEMESLFKRLDEKFATKEEHQENKSKIDSLSGDIKFNKKILWTGGSIVLLAVLAKILENIGL